MTLQKDLNLVSLRPTFHLASQADASAVSALVNAAYSKWIDVLGGRKPRPMTADYPGLIAQGHVWLVQLADELAGVVVLWQQDDALYIDNIAVSPAFQRQGIAHHILAFAEDQARALGLSRLTLKTNAKMESNQAYYKRHGFTETGRESAPDVGTIVHMARSL